MEVQVGRNAAISKTKYDVRWGTELARAEAGSRLCSPAARPRAGGSLKLRLNLQPSAPASTEVISPL